MNNPCQLLSGFLLAVFSWISCDAQSALQSYTIDTVIEALDRPYALAFLPDGDLLITEKSTNKLRIIQDGGSRSLSITGAPAVLLEGSYAGLLDIVIHPQFRTNQFIYLSFTYGTKEANAVRVIRARYANQRLNDIIDIFTSFPLKDTLNHAGGHLAFLPDNSLLITVGDGYEYREKAQDLSSMLGKIVRVTDQGEIPTDNPFTNNQGSPSPVWSYGHRNSLGLLYDPVSETMYEHENGPRGGDEINIIKPGKNYGWPLVTHGLDYSGAAITPFKEYPGTEQPLVHWTPSLAPSGITQCRDCLWREWEGDLFIGMLGSRHIRRIRIENGKVIEQEALFTELGERIRNLRFGPDGALYVLTDSVKGKLLKITPNK